MWITKLYSISRLTMGCKWEPRTGFILKLTTGDKKSTSIVSSHLYLTYAGVPQGSTLAWGPLFSIIFLYIYIWKNRGIRVFPFIEREFNLWLSYLVFWQLFSVMPMQVYEPEYRWNSSFVEINIWVIWLARQSFYSHTK